MGLCPCPWHLAAKGEELGFAYSPYEVLPVCWQGYPASACTVLSCIACSNGALRMLSSNIYAPATDAVLLPCTAAHWQQPR